MKRRRSRDEILIEVQIHDITTHARVQLDLRRPGQPCCWVGWWEGIERVRERQRVNENGGGEWVSRRVQRPQAAQSPTRRRQPETAVGLFPRSGVEWWPGGPDRNMNSQATARECAAGGGRTCTRSTNVHLPISPLLYQPTSISITLFSPRACDGEKESEHFSPASSNQFFHPQNFTINFYIILYRSHIK